jgi:outer membrane protein assembly factor BamB
MASFGNRYLPCLVAAGALFAATPTHAQEWTRFRGPNGTGISNATTVPVEYSAATGNWRTELPGVGHSSPVVWGDKVFLTSADETAGKRYLLCIRTTDGKILWRKSYDFSKHGRHKFNNFAASTAAVDAQHVYVPWFSPDGLSLHAVTHDGKDGWVRELGKWEGNHAGGCSPIVVDGLVILRSDSDATGPESFVVALDTKNGEIRWKTPRISKDAGYGTPVLYQPKGGPAELIVVGNNHGVTSLDPKTGTINWELGGMFIQRVVSTPVIIGDLIFGTAGNGAGARQAVAVRVGSKGGKTAEVAYKIPRGVPYVPTPIVYNGMMFLWGDAGIVTCVKADTGEEIWSDRVGGNFFGSPVCVNGKIYGISADGEMVVIEAGPQFKVLGRSKLEGTSHASPAVSGGVMYVRTETHLISFGGKK